MKEKEGRRQKEQCGQTDGGAEVEMLGPSRWIQYNWSFSGPVTAYTS